MIRMDDPFYTFLLDHEQALKKEEYPEFLFTEFCKAVWSFYQQRGRFFTWRSTYEPYHIIVSEIMLQQTQTSRVAEKYDAFLKKFPTFKELAQASTVDVLTEWVGLGYNRRALALQSIAQTVMEQYNGVLPNDPVILETFKGLGPATAASICAFSFNRPTVFIETNIRTVYIHAFFGHRHEPVSDKELLPLIATTVDKERAREWYYALMDCGVELKKLYKNPSRRSKHHSRQSRFEGSDRQIRGAVVRFLTQHKTATHQELQALGFQKNRLDRILKDLCAEQFIHLSESKYSFV